jgi:hypothetical protein
VVHVLVPFMSQMFRPFLPFLDTTFRVLSGALVVPAMFGTFPVVARIVQIIGGVRVLPPCQARASGRCNSCVEA